MVRPFYLHKVDAIGNRFILPVRGDFQIVA